MGGNAEAVGGDTRLGRVGRDTRLGQVGRSGLELGQSTDRAEVESSMSLTVGKRREWKGSPRGRERERRRNRRVMPFVLYFLTTKKNSNSN